MTELKKTLFSKLSENEKKLAIEAYLYTIISRGFEMKNSKY